MSTVKSGKKAPKAGATSAKTQVVVGSQDEKDSLKLMEVLKVVGQAKIMKTPTDRDLHPLLSNALKEINALPLDKRDYGIEVFLRNLFYVFSIQRDHNIWKKHSVKSDPLGAQMRVSGRVITRWLYNNFPDWLTKRDSDGYLVNLSLLAEYANYDLLTHNQLRTKTPKGTTGKQGSKSNPNKVVSHEEMPFPVSLVAEVMAQNYTRDNGRSLIARWLPKYSKGKMRYTKLVVGKDIKTKKFTPPEGRKITVNGIPFDQTVDIKDGDIIRYTRKIGKEAKERMNSDNQLVREFCRILGWNTKKYKEFRKEYMKKTPENMFSTRKILKLKKDEFADWMNKLTSGQQFVVSSTLAYKDTSGKIASKPEKKWGELHDWYIAWFAIQEQETQKIREAMAKGDTVTVKEVQKNVKLKTAGLQTFDLLSDILSGRKSNNEINALHTTLISKMEMLVPVYTILDGSGSMGSMLHGSATRLDVCLTLGITFMITNPVEEFRSSCMWFGSETTFTGVTKYSNTAPNAYLTGDKFNKTHGPKLVVDPAKTFTENLESLRRANPGRASCTNAGAVVTTFMNLVKNGQLNSESLPRVLLFITDEEYNTGVNAVQSDGKGFTQIPQTIGWNPLFVFWGLVTTAHLDKYKDAPNCMVTRGFNENNLSQILQFIKKGSISMCDELFAVHEMSGLSLIKYP